ncbi:MAG: hypothetical protein GX254_06790 [Clostridiales bacterium]|nr:hypothetical protein [Clostridiales bacterium]
MAFVIFPVFALMALFDFPKLINDKRSREIKLLSALYIIAFALAFMQALGMEIPSLIKWIRDVILDVLKIGYSL